MIERSQDYRRIRKLTGWNMVLSPEVFYLILVEDGVDFGVWAFLPHKGQLIAHVSMTEQCRGKKALQGYRAASQWIFENTRFDTICAEIPGDYKAAHIMASHIGMVYDGTNDDGFRCFSIKKRDVLDDRKVA